MTTPVTVSEARSTLPEILDRVDAGEEVVLTRHGKPVAVVVRPDTLRVRRAEGALAQASALQDLVDSALSEPLPRVARISRRRADELVDEIYASRSSR